VVFDDEFDGEDSFVEVALLLVVLVALDWF
jgi:hypothetical protein